MENIYEKIAGVFLALITVLILGVVFDVTPAQQLAQDISGYSGFLSLSFSAVLATLYLMQWRTQKGLHDLTEAQYHPELKASLEMNGPLLMDLVLRNTGNAVAHDVEFEWSIGDDANEWAVSIISEGDSHRFPVISGEKGGIRNIKTLATHIDKNSLDGVLEYDINCTDSLGNSHKFTDEIDIIEVIEKRTQATEYLENEPLEDIVSELDDIEDQLKEIKRGVGGDIGSRVLNSRSTTSYPETQQSETDEQGSTETEKDSE